MSEIQRFQWTELTKDGIGLPDDVVLYSDHAAEVSALRERVAELQDQAQALSNGLQSINEGYIKCQEDRDSLRAQLEAAEKRLDQREQVLGMYIDKLHEAHKRINALSKPASCRFCGGDTHAQLTAPAPQVRVYQDTEDAYKDTAPPPSAEVK